MIRYYGGVEGSGKTCMMTRDLYLHYASGGRVLSFPGYELYGDNKHQVLSELIMPEELLALLDNENVNVLRKQRIAVGIDEVGNFFNHHNWYGKINDIMRAILAERRKLGIVLLMTGPEFENLPPDLRSMVHEIIRCWDAHSFNRSVARGAFCKYYKEDRRGLLSMPWARHSPRHKFYMKPWYHHFDTYAAVDSLHQFLKLKIKGREVVVGPDGRPLESNAKLDTSKFEGIMAKYQPVDDPEVSKVQQVLDYLKKKGTQRVEKGMLLDMLGEARLDGGRKGIGVILNSFGASYDRNRKVYDISSC